MLLRRLRAQRAAIHGFDRDVIVKVDNAAEFLVRWLPAGWLRQVAEALHDEPRPDILVAPSMSPGARKAARNAGVSWVDESGAADIYYHDPKSGTVIAIQTEGTPSVPLDTRLGWRRATLAVCEALLADAATPTVNSVVAATGIAMGSAQNALKFLERDGHLASDTSGPASTPICARRACAAKTRPSSCARKWVREVPEVEAARTAAARRAAELGTGARCASLRRTPRVRCAGRPSACTAVRGFSMAPVQAQRLEEALRNAGFVPDGTRDWRWILTDPSGARATVKFVLLADLDNQPAGATVRFDGCDRLGAANLRGTGCAAQNFVVQKLRANDHGTWREAEVNVAGLAGFLLAKLAAAHGRHKPKDWYDIAFVPLNNDHGDAHAAAGRVLEVFGPPTGTVRTQLLDLQANFADSSAQGTSAYVEQFTLDHPEVERDVAAADAQLAVTAFTDHLLGGGASRHKR